MSDLPPSGLRVEPVEPGDSGSGPVMSPPPVLNYAKPQGGRKLRDIALGQRMVNVCILIAVVSMILMFSAPEAGSPLVVVVVLVAIVCSVFVFKLALSLYSLGWGIVIGLLTLIPYLGLLVLLIMNGRATAVLRDHGVRVGLLGADPDRIPPDQMV